MPPANNEFDEASSLPANNPGVFKPAEPRPPVAPATAPPKQGRVMAVAVGYSGPLPPPDMLKEYNKVLPGAAERILAMAERQAEHRQELERRVIGGGVSNSYWGLRAGFAIAVFLIGLSMAAIFAGHDAAGATVLIATLVGLVGVFLGQRSRQAKELRGKADRVPPADPPSDLPT